MNWEIYLYVAIAVNMVFSVISNLSASREWNALGAFVFNGLMLHALSQIT